MKKNPLSKDAINILKKYEHVDSMKTAHTTLETGDLEFLLGYLEESVRIERSLRDKIKKYETPTRVANYLRDISVNQHDEIECILTIHGVEHTLPISRKNARGFTHSFWMHDVERHALQPNQETKNKKK